MKFNVWETIRDIRAGAESGKTLNIIMGETGAGKSMNNLLPFQEQVGPIIKHKMGLITTMNEIYPGRFEIPVEGNHFPTLENDQLDIYNITHEFDCEHTKQRFLVTYQCWLTGVDWALKILVYEPREILSSQVVDGYGVVGTSVTREPVFIRSESTGMNRIVNRTDQKCIASQCPNHTSQGTFVGDLCLPCHRAITLGDSSEIEHRNFIQRLPWLAKHIEELENEIAELKSKDPE